MLRVAFQGLRGRKGPFVGAFLALAVAAALVMACGTLLQAESNPNLRSSASRPLRSSWPGPERDRQRRPTPRTASRSSSAPGSRRRWSRAWLPWPACATPSATSQCPPHCSAARRGRRPDRAPERVAPVETAALTPYTLRSGRAPKAADELSSTPACPRVGQSRRPPRSARVGTCRHV